MQEIRHSAILAAAGSGKTTELARRALLVPPEETVLLTTYTSTGEEAIRRAIRSHCGVTPANITVMSWFTFLYRHGLLPYQNPYFGINWFRGIHFEHPGQRWIKKTDIVRFFADQSRLAYKDFLAELVVLVDELHDGAVFSRISTLFNHVMVDELQDLSAGDFDVLKRLCDVCNSVVVVGDPRQGTFSTSRDRKNRQYVRSNVLRWLNELNDRKVFLLENRNFSYRCREEICRFSDLLFPEFPATEPLNQRVTGHDGLFAITSEEVGDYVERFSPQVLVWENASKREDRARNFGDVKGLTFKRVLIYPTKTIEEYLSDGKPLKEGTRAKFYVAVTRASQSVAIVLNGEKPNGLDRWERS